MLAPAEELRASLAHRYEVRGVLGEGGMGAVYDAHDLKHDRRVAIKTIRPDLATDAIRARFEREIRITARLQHPHILPLLDSGVARDTLFYVMPHVEGESLRARLERAGALPLEEAVRIAGDVAEGLAYAHDLGVIHRDIKPENILLAPDYALILDFGIGKALTDPRDGTLTRTGWLLGSPNYMAPEQLDGVASPRTDVYALGCVLYEAATGHRPTRTHAGWYDIPSDLQRVIVRATNPSPDARFSDAGSFRRALRLPSTAARPTRGSRPVAGLIAAAATIALSVATANRWLDRPSAAGSAVASVAVLPLTNLTGDPEETYFVAGVHEAFISELAKSTDLRVISRTSVSRYAETDLTIPRIANELGVTAIVEGGVRRVGDRVLVDVRLIDAAADRHLWAQSYDETLSAENLFAIQQNLATRVATALEAALSPVTARAPPTKSLEAFDRYARGRYLYNRFASYEDRELALDLFRDAIEADSTYALAYVGLAEAYAFLGGQGYLPPDEAIPLARLAAERALSLDETLAEAHSALGGVLTGELRFEEAERAFRRALELDPSSADVHRQYGRLLNRLGRAEEAVREGRLAVELDPLSVGNRVSLASRLFYARDYQGVIAEARHVLDMEPDDVGAHFFLGGAYMLDGQHEKGLASLYEARRLDPENPFRVTMLAWAHARAGQREAALGLLQGIEARGRLLKELAIVYAELGESDLAIEHLERARLEDPASLAALRVDPTADALRRDPRFEESLRVLGLQ